MMEEEGTILGTNPSLPQISISDKDAVINRFRGFRYRDGSQHKSHLKMMQESKDNMKPNSYVKRQIFS